MSGLTSFLDLEQDLLRSLDHPACECGPDKYVVQEEDTVNQVNEAASWHVLGIYQSTAEHDVENPQHPVLHHDVASLSLIVNLHHLVA